MALALTSGIGIDIGKWQWLVSDTKIAYKGAKRVLANAYISGYPPNNCLTGNYAFTDIMMRAGFVQVTVDANNAEMSWTDSPRKLNYSFIGNGTKIKMTSIV